MGSSAALLDDAIGHVAAAVPQGDRVAVQAHLDALTKPPGSLGRLEELALQVGCVQGDPPPSLDSAVVFVFAADHGVAAQGVSAYPAEVTAQMCANFSGGGAAISVLTRSCGAEVRVVDVGVAADVAGLAGIEHRKVRAGTEDLSAGPAMTAHEVIDALATHHEIQVAQHGVYPALYANPNLAGYDCAGGVTTGAACVISPWAAAVGAAA